MLPVTSNVIAYTLPHLLLLVPRSKSGPFGLRLLLMSAPNTTLSVFESPNVSVPPLRVVNPCTVRLPYTLVSPATLNDVKLPTVVKLELTTAVPNVVAFNTEVPAIAYLSPDARFTPSASTVCSVVPSILIVTVEEDPVSLILTLLSFLEIWLTPKLPVITMLPEVLMSPVAASIVSGPTVSPCWTTKFLLAIFPYLQMCFILLFMPAKKIAPGGAILRTINCAVNYIIPWPMPCPASVLSSLGNS